MRILDRSVYVGPSLYAHFPVIRLELDLGELEQWPSARIGEEFISGLVQALPGLAEHGCSYREPGGFLRLQRFAGGNRCGRHREGQAELARRHAVARFERGHAGQARFSRRLDACRARGGGVAPLRIRPLVTHASSAPSSSSHSSSSTAFHSLRISGAASSTS